MSERIFNGFERMYLRLRTNFDRYTQLCPRYKNKQPYNRKTKLCINIHNSAKLWCGKLGGKCGKAHGIVEKAKLFTRYRLYMERQYTLRIHFYDMLRAGTLKSSVKWIGNVISTYTIKGVCFQTRQKARRSEPLRAQSIEGHAAAVSFLLRWKRKLAAKIATETRNTQAVTP